MRQPGPYGYRGAPQFSHGYLLGSSGEVMLSEIRQGVSLTTSDLTDPANNPRLIELRQTVALTTDALTATPKLSAIIEGYSANEETIREGERTAVWEETDEQPAVAILAEAPLTVVELGMVRAYVRCDYPTPDADLLDLGTYRRITLRQLVPLEAPATLVQVLFVFPEDVDDRDLKLETSRFRASEVS